MSKIDRNTAQVKQALEHIEEFKTDDMFVHCHNNYLKVYQELMKQREVVEFEFRPLIEQTQIDKAQLVKTEDHERSERRILASEKLIEVLRVEVTALKDVKVELLDKVELLESQTPAGRKRKGMLEKQGASSGARAAEGDAPLVNTSPSKSLKIKSNNNTGLRRSEMGAQGSVKGAPSVGSGDSPAQRARPA